MTLCTVITCLRCLQCDLQTLDELKLLFENNLAVVDGKITEHCSISLDQHKAPHSLMALSSGWKPDDRRGNVEELEQCLRSVLPEPD